MLAEENSRRIAEEHFQLFLFETVEPQFAESEAVGPNDGHPVAAPLPKGTVLGRCFATSLRRFVVFRSFLGALKHKY